MHNLNQTLDALEVACESEADLIAFSDPQLAEIIETVKSLPEDERAAVRERLDRINTIIEGQILLYSEEIGRLGGQIRNITLNNAAAHAYRTVAVIPIKDNPGAA